MLRVSLDLIRCPRSGQRLHVAENGDLASADNQNVYPVTSGIPVLVDDETSLFSSGEILAGPPTPPSRLACILRSAAPRSTLNPGAQERYERFAHLVVQGAGASPARVLIVGCGNAGKGIEVLQGKPHIALTNSDVYLSPTVTVVCDGHNLPFVDEVFDGVVVQAVLEHVLEPWQVVSEIHRVLRPGALVYAETPFMQQVHEGAFDFTRFTELGHRRLFRMFEEIDRGVAAGPASALVWSLRYFAASLPRRSRVAARALDRLTLLATFWLQYLDYIVADHPGGHDAASGCYFLGSRSDEPIQDRALLATYRGTLGTVPAKSSLSR